MRRRSNAFHSDTQQQFLQLAQLAQQKTGYYYDQSLHSEVYKQLKIKFDQPQSPPSSDRPHLFNNFDFAAQDPYHQEQQQQLKAENKAKLLHFTLICDCQQELKNKLIELWPNNEDIEAESPERRGIDLYMAKTVDNNGHVHCFKFWILEGSSLSNPLFFSYLKRALKVLNFSEIDKSAGQVHPLSDAKGVLFSMVNAFTN